MQTGSLAMADDNRDWRQASDRDWRLASERALVRLLDRITELTQDCTDLKTLVSVAEKVAEVVDAAQVEVEK